MHVIDRMEHHRLRKIIADNIRLMVETSGMQNAEIAQRMGQHEGLISHLKRGRGVPSILTLKSLATAVGCSLLDLISGID